MSSQPRHLNCSHSENFRIDPLIGITIYIEDISEAQLDRNSEVVLSSLLHLNDVGLRQHNFFRENIVYL